MGSDLYDEAMITAASQGGPLWWITLGIAGVFVGLLLFAAIYDDRRGH